MFLPLSFSLYLYLYLSRLTQMTLTGHDLSYINSSLSRSVSKCTKL